MSEALKKVIFSKNRAAQLELLLRSLNIPVVVIYTFDPEFEKGYEKLKKLYPDTLFILQKNFRDQILSNLGKYTMFLVDDDVMIGAFDENCPEFTWFKKNPKIICLSLRMSPHLERGRPPISDDNTWVWRGQPHSWGYPMSVSAHIFRLEDIEPAIASHDMTLPHHLEHVLRANPPDRPLMLCFDQPKIVNNQANLVQSEYWSKNLGIDPHDLEKRFLNGERLSLEYIKEKSKGAKDCFVRIHYQWE